MAQPASDYHMMTNHEKHTFLREMVLHHLQTVWGNLRTPQVRNNHLDEQATLDAIDHAIRVVREQMDKYVTTL
jgi:hypothetical protein